MPSGRPRPASANPHSTGAWCGGWPRREPQAAPNHPVRVEAERTYGHVHGDARLALTPSLPLPHPGAGRGRESHPIGGIGHAPPLRPRAAARTGENVPHAYARRSQTQNQRSCSERAWYDADHKIPNPLQRPPARHNATAWGASDRERRPEHGAPADAPSAGGVCSPGARHASPRRARRRGRADARRLRGDRVVCAAAHRAGADRPPGAGPHLRRLLAWLGAGRRSIRLHRALRAPQLARQTGRRRDLGRHQPPLRRAGRGDLPLSRHAAQVRRRCADGLLRRCRARPTARGLRLRRGAGAATADGGVPQRRDSRRRLSVATANRRP